MKINIFLLCLCITLIFVGCEGHIKYLPISQGIIKENTIEISKEKINLRIKGRWSLGVIIQIEINNENSQKLEINFDKFLLKLRSGTILSPVGVSNFHGIDIDDRFFLLDSESEIECYLYFEGDSGLKKLVDYEQVTLLIDGISFEETKINVPFKIDFIFENKVSSASS